MFLIRVSTAQLAFLSLILSLLTPLYLVGITAIPIEPVRSKGFEPLLADPELL
jgi:hypothetical protein